ncbi:MAG TPA: FAD-dependent oxidoreductase [Candidatus Polarisedimenticolia bacterium]|nr:FAD-dependent oxidoreductase [Candidatus Polarisedimenticolia bacterium]
MIVVLGGGLTGLSAALHLQETEEVLVLEREDRPGGLCRSVRQDGFTFDLTGHLLHLRRPEIRALVESLIPADRFVAIDRRAYIHSHGVYTPYPFQVNTHGLPPEVIAECLVGFAEAGRGGEVPGEDAESLSFKQWAVRTFGAGIARHFMIPYNEKLWLSDLDEVTSEWVSWSIPRPSLQDVVEGALGISRKVFGYNPSFLYPKEGGIQVLPAALASRVRSLRCNVEAARVDTAARTVRTVQGEEIPYDTLISTLPLPRLIELCDRLPEEAAAAARGLRHVAVVNLNLGFDRVVHPDKHWVYFPEKDFVFYRAGFPASFTASAAPAGCSSVYLEMSVRPGDRPDRKELLSAARAGLEKAGIVLSGDRILTELWFHIDPAYVIYDRHRRAALPALKSVLLERGIHSAGRYGAWYYNSMEDSMADGRDLAMELLRARQGRAAAR